MVEVMKIMVTSFKRSDVHTATLSAPNPAAGHHQPTLLLETPGHSQAGDVGLIPWVRKMPWSRRWQPTPEFLPGESHG